MQLGIVIGLSVMLGVIAVFLVYFIRGVLDSEDSTTVDQLPDSQPKS
jgi:hypothetical protein